MIRTSPFSLLRLCGALATVPLLSGCVAAVAVPLMTVVGAATERKRTREEAKKRAEEALTKLRIGADFDALVKEYTDEPGGVERNGDLGVFDRSTMVKTFAEAAFVLQVGQVSDIVETVYGFHIIKRTE